MEEQELQYIKGFNGGYLLAQHEPDLTIKVLGNLQAVNEYTQGLISGKEEWIKEKEQEQLQELNSLRNQSQNREYGLDRNLNE